VVPRVGARGRRQSRRCPESLSRAPAVTALGGGISGVGYLVCLSTCALLYNKVDTVRSELCSHSNMQSRKINSGLSFLCPLLHVGLSMGARARSAGCAPAEHPQPPPVRP